MRTDDLTTPALVVDADALEDNLATMAARWPGARLRPHVKAHKTTALAHRQAAHGHPGFTCATIREVEGMVAAGLGDDLLLANEVLDTRRLGVLVEGGARVTVAVDSAETVDAAAAGGVREVLVDVNVGLPRCGVPPEGAGALADRARARGLGVRGVMGYEGHLQLLPDLDERAKLTEECMDRLRAAHVDVGGDVVSGGGTGTSAVNTAVTEMQAGSYALMDTAYTAAGAPYRQALTVLATVVSVSAPTPTMPGYAVADVGLKSLGMDHGTPTIPDATVWFCSDEHTTLERHVPADVTKWYVDDVIGDTIVATLGMPTPADEAFAADPDPAEVLVVPFSRTPTPVASTDLLGGQTITNSGVRCSVGFNGLTSANKPVFLTAGHCTKTAGTWAGVNRAAIGPVATTAWPKVDYGSVSIANTAAWAARAQVAGGPAVKGTTVAAVNAQVCRSGSTTGYRCGTITARNVSVNYGNGNVVDGLTKTSACAEGGDSGGSFITPAGQAQGLASGSAGDCTKGGSSYFQPIAPVLSALKVRLVNSP